MAKTQIADIIVPAQFAPYVLQRTAEKSDLVQSGIVARNPDYDDRAGRGGTQVDMPHWNDLTGNRQPLSDSSPLTAQKLSADTREDCLQGTEDMQHDGCQCKAVSKAPQPGGFGVCSELQLFESFLRGVPFT